MKILRSQFDTDLIPCDELLFTSPTAFGFDFSKADWPGLQRVVDEYFDDVTRVHEGYRELRQKLGIGWRNRIPAPVRLSGREDRLAEVPNLIRAYNRISGWSGLALGMHDIAKLAGRQVTLRTLDSRTQFFRVDGKEVFAEEDEYCYLDDDGVVCRLEVMQCQRTSVDPDTGDFFMIFQGNPRTPMSYIEAVRNWTRSMVALAAD